MQTKENFNNDKVIALKMENETLKQTIYEFHNRIASKERQANERVEVDPKTGKRISIEQAITELHSLARIGEDSESNALNVTNGDKFMPIEQVEVYEQRYHELNKKYVQALEDMQDYKVKAIGEGELLQERDERIRKTYKELELLKGMI